ncbi:hypothetical protein KUF71_010032 [Frankliniella fusca]|uniref:Uncharacterized protein n=1 Tax=Frankliniella fusca TaxID=407009 RepID=A0AAE1LIL1_9NEOP|nr:hypothetical protein KUF71_010032 [Frankliniella fusca]
MLVTSAKNILDGLVLLFGSYYTFNILYPEKLACFLNYFQRAIAKFCPTKGSKVKAPSTARRANDKVVKLQNKFTMYKQTLEAEANEPL